MKSQISDLIFLRPRFLNYKLYCNLRIVVHVQVLFMIQLITSIFLTQSLHQYLEGDNKEGAERQEVYERFGTFARSFLTILSSIK